MKKKQDTVYVRIAVLGGGASGLMAAFAASQALLSDGTAQSSFNSSDNSVVLLEKNDQLGKKILATGNGRCNLSNRFCLPGDFDGVTCEKSPEFVKQVLEQYSVSNTIDLFAKIGILTREEGDGRLYPYSLQASSVRDALAEAVSRNGAAIRCGASVERIDSSNGFQILLNDGSRIFAEKVVLAVGGLAGGQYGCSGDGYRIAKLLGHSVSSPMPALVQLESDHPALQAIGGVRARGSVSLFQGKKWIGTSDGEIQFTQKGLSGICVFDLSRFLRGGMKSNQFHVVVDLFPEFSQKKLLELLVQRKKDLYDRKTLSFLDGLIPQKLSAALLSEAGFHEKELKKTVVEVLSFEKLRTLADGLKSWSFPITGTRPWNEAQVTAGGVDLSEISSNTMESKLISGLYFAGELLDVDGRCGGFNLQWAWSTGFLAGQSAAR